MRWMIYGANGYTGELIAREAKRRGLAPILAGRSREKVEPLARELGLEWRAFPVEVADLSGVGLVLHCAGPFIRTSVTMVSACLDAGAHYLDITGEIAVFESIFARNGDARGAGVTLLPGVGFDVVPTDCLAALLHERLPDATELQLAFDPGRGGTSAGTRKTMLEGLGTGGAVRQGGVIVQVPHLYDVRDIPFAPGPRCAVTIPWGDVSTAFHTTGIPDIRVYMASSRKALKGLRRTMRFERLLALKPIKRILQKMAERDPGPSADRRAAGRVQLWGRVANPEGAEVTMTMSTPEGYTFTVLSALAAVERVMAEPAQGGAFTPSRRLGKAFALSIEGVTLGPAS